MTPWRLHEARPEDRGALLDLWVEAWTAAMPAIDFEARRPWFRARLDDMEAAGAVTLVGRHDGPAILGFVTVDVAAGYLDQLAVRPTAQGSGLAGRLTGEAKHLSQAGLSLHVNQDNHRAVRFYRREGFATIEAGINSRSGLPVWRMHWPGAAS